MADVDRIADGLPDEVRAERPAAESVILEELLACPEVAGSAVAKAGSRWSPQVAISRPSKPQPAAFSTTLAKGKIGPLAREERDGSIGQRLAFSTVTGARVRAERSHASAMTSASTAAWAGASLLPRLAQRSR